MRKIEVLLAHVMGMEDDADIPHERGMSIVHAAAKLVREQHIQDVVVAGQHYWGENERLPLGLVTARALTEELESTQTKAAVTALSYWPEDGEFGSQSRSVVETSGEVLAFLAFARENDLQNVASISSATHVPSIRQLYRFYGVPAQVFAAEEVLSTEYTFEDEDDFKKRERLKRLIYHAPLGIGINFLRSKAEKERQVSTQARGWITTLTGRRA